MKAIKTTYLGPTNTKPSRIKASAEGVSAITLTCDDLDIIRVNDKLEHITNHQCAAQILALKNDWPTNLASGGLPDGSWAHCFVQDEISAQGFPTGKSLVVAQARVLVEQSPAPGTGLPICDAYHFGLLKNALDQLDGNI